MEDGAPATDACEVEFSFRTFSDPSSVAGVHESKTGDALLSHSESKHKAPDEAPDDEDSEGAAPDDDERVDDCYYGDQAEEDQFQPEQSSESGTDSDYETGDSDAEV